MVFVARVGIRRVTYDPSGARITEWSFQTVEQLKGKVTFDKLVRGSCGGRVVEGEEYLIFTSEQGPVGTCTSGQLNRNERYRADLEVLRKHRHGDLRTLSEPWVFTKRVGVCTLSLDMAVGHGSLMFEYRFADAVTPDISDQQFHYDTNEHRTLKFEGVGLHPVYFAGFRRLRIRYPHTRYKVEGTGRLKIGGREWTTEHQNMEARFSPFEVVTDSAFSEVLAEVQSHNSAELAAEYTDFPYNLSDYPDFPVIKAATPLYYRGTAVEEFQDCINRAGQ